MGMERRQVPQAHGERDMLHRGGGVFPLPQARQTFAASTLNKVLLEASGSSWGFL